MFLDSYYSSHNMSHVLTLVTYHHTQTVQALSQCRYDRRALPGLRSKFTSSVLGKLTHMLMRSRRRTGEGVQGGRERLESLTAVSRLFLCHNPPLSLSLSSLPLPLSLLSLPPSLPLSPPLSPFSPSLSPSLSPLSPFSPSLSLPLSPQLAVWLRDIVNDLCHCKLRSISDFEWLRYPRLYLTPPSPSPSSPPSPQSQPGDRLEVKCLHMTMEYGFEYVGCQSLPVFTPRMNNYIISLLQACRLTPTHTHTHTQYTHTHIHTHTHTVNISLSLGYGIGPTQYGMWTAELWQGGND